MLTLKPNCEWCDRDLAPDASDARICSYECTYCAHCVVTVLHNVCPTCGGGFTPRPIRPKKPPRPGINLGLAHHPASTDRIKSRWSKANVETLSKKLRDTDPSER